MRRGLACRPAPEFRARIEVVVIDPSAPYASGIRAALPDAKIAVDKFHLAIVANQMLTAVRQRVTRELLGRRGRKVDPPWAARRMLLTGNSSPAVNSIGSVLCSRLTPPIRSARPGPSRSCSAGCSRLVTRPTSAVASTTSTPPAPTPTCPKRPDSQRLSKRGGRRCSCSSTAGHQRPHRRVQPHHQAGEAHRLRLPEHGQLPAAHHGSYRGHQTRATNSMLRPPPPQMRRAPSCMSDSSDPAAGQGIASHLPNLQQFAGEIIPALPEAAAAERGRSRTGERP